MPDPAYITLEEAVLVVEGLVAWLKYTPEGATLQARIGDEMTMLVPDAQRAGYVLETLMHTSGVA